MSTFSKYLAAFRNLMPPTNTQVHWSKQKIITVDTVILGIITSLFHLLRKRFHLLRKAKTAGQHSTQVPILKSLFHRKNVGNYFHAIPPLPTEIKVV